MNISYDNEIVKRCFKPDQTVLHNLNVTCNAWNTTIIFWNKFQIFVHENCEFNTVAKIFVPEFQIHDLLVSKNHLICLDDSGNVHITSLKFKNAQKICRYSFQPREHGIVASSLYEEDQVLCLKFETNSYLLCLHKINTEFSSTKKVILMHDEDLPYIQIKDKYIIQVHNCIENLDKDNLKNIFKMEDMNLQENFNLVLITFDKITLYGCLFSSKMVEEHVTLVKLYTCPSEISNLQVTKQGDYSIIIGLTIGTLLKLSLKDLKTPEIIHLNIAIHNFFIKNGTVIYSDGISTWKADNAICNKDIKFRQFFVKHVTDFTNFGDLIICTTAMNLIYTFSADNENSYLKLETVDEYCSAEKLLCNSEYLKKIMAEVKKNDTLIKTLSKEKNYITALSLSNRQDIMDSIINNKVIVYQNYEDAVYENPKAVLTNDPVEYFDTESFFVLIKISTTSEHKLGDILSNTLGDLRIHITFSTETKVVKTTTINVIEQLKKVSFLIPLKSRMVDISEMNVNIKIMLNIPGALNTKQHIWAVIYRSKVILHSEHFIKFDLSPPRQKCLKRLKPSLDNLILQTAEKQHGNLFTFTDILKEKPASKEWQMYVRLPNQYQEVFKNKDCYTNHFNSKKVSYFLQQFTADNFLKGESNLIYHIGNDKVKIEIHNDSFTNPLLKISSANIKIALNIRNFFSDLLYCVLINCSPGKDFINLSTYSAVENLQKAVKKCIAGSSEEEIEPLIEQFERNVIGVLPI